MISVVGGCYLERCVSPGWRHLLGSAGRAAVALSNVSKVQLSTYVDSEQLPRLEALVASTKDLELQPTSSQRTLGFAYVHPLSVPTILPSLSSLNPEPPISVSGSVQLRFGMLEGEAIVAGDRVVYDPQSAFSPQHFGANGSKAGSLAIVGNAREVMQLGGSDAIEDAARNLLVAEKAAVVVVKRGTVGALVFSPGGRASVPAYRSELVFKIGSGDIFAAAYTYFWGLQGLDPTESADLASRTTALYCESRSMRVLERTDLLDIERQVINAKPGRAYLAGPFFSLAEKWLVEEARGCLRANGLDVFSPFHDVGPGPAEIVGPADLKALEDCDRMLALLGTGDPGTLVEVGFARARGLPVVAYSERLSEEDLKMVVGSGCSHTDDFATAVYHTAWI